MLNKKTCNALILLNIENNKIKKQEIRCVYPIETTVSVRTQAVSTCKVSAMDQSVMALNKYISSNE